MFQIGHHVVSDSLSLSLIGNPIRQLLCHKHGRSDYLYSPTEIHPVCHPMCGTLTVKRQLMSRAQLAPVASIVFVQETTSP